MFCSDLDVVIVIFQVVYDLKRFSSLFSHGDGATRNVLMLVFTLKVVKHRSWLSSTQTPSFFLILYLRTHPLCSKI